MSYTLHQGDCIEVMRGMPDNSVDSIVTDPPYELGFMGKSWDSTGIANSVAMWTEALRVLKPGGHLLAFSGSRTYHRMVCAIEDAGFEVRDQMMWVYGSGFPKSLDVSKAIDKAGEWNADFDDVRSWLRQKVKEKGLKHAEIDRALGNENSHMASHFLGVSQPSLPTWDQWIVIKALLGVDEDIDRPPKYVGFERAIIGVRKVNAGLAFTSDGPTELTVTAPASDAAKQWAGWGTALKPAHEPICMARKPLIGTVAANVQVHGTGALNIDACRVATDARVDDPRLAGSGAWKTDKAAQNVYAGGFAGETIASSPLGRWPANIIHDGSDEVLAGFPITASGTGAVKRASSSDSDGNTGAAYGSESRPAGTPMISHGDAGSAARFFYCAKASKDDRDEGCAAMAMKALAYGNQAQAEVKRGNTAHKGDSGMNTVKMRANHHPTVKPTDLMAYLCRLVTPPGGTVLDPFMGSGSTGKAAVLEGFNFIGIDLSPEYVEIARARIEHAQRQGHQPSLDLEAA